MYHKRVGRHAEVQSQQRKPCILYYIKSASSAPPREGYGTKLPKGIQRFHRNLLCGKVILAIPQSSAGEHRVSLGSAGGTQRSRAGREKLLFGSASNQRPLRLRMRAMAQSFPKKYKVPQRYFCAPLHNLSGTLWHNQKKSLRKYRGIFLLTLKTTNMEICW